jgi:hypothetical protein
MYKESQPQNSTPNLYDHNMLASNEALSTSSSFYDLNRQAMLSTTAGAASAKQQQSTANESTKGLGQMSGTSATDSLSKSSSSFINAARSSTFDELNQYQELLNSSSAMKQQTQPQVVGCYYN